MTSTTTTTEPQEGANMTTTTTTPTTYVEACEHAERSHRETGGLVLGGTYLVRFDSGVVAEVELRVGESGVARPVR